MENFTSNAQVHGNTIRWLFSLSILCFVFISYSQELSTTNKKARKLYEKADKAYKARDFETSIDLLEEAGKLDASFFEAYIRMGSLYNALGEVDSVYAKFRHYLTVVPTPVTSILEKMAFMAFDRGHYQESINYLNMFLNKVPDKRKDREILLLQSSLSFALAEVANPDSLQITDLPQEINRFGLQYLPAMTVDKRTLIYTKRDVVTDDEDIVVSFFKEGRWTPAESISPRINGRLNEGASTISADGRTMIFTACDRKNSFGSCDLFITKKTGEHWSKPKNLGKAVNSKYWESQPSLSADGKTLYFVSNRPGGFGGRDIWVTKSDEDSKWNEPQNLGEAINTFKDETTPFIHFNGESLFFSSDGYPGMGGFDLYKSEKLDSTWKKPENLGYPINSYRDEVALLISSTGTEGYFAKEVKKGYEILDSKIVSFTLPESIRPSKSSYIAGRVIDKESGRPLKSSIQVVDLVTGSILYSNYSDSLTGEFYMVLPANKELAGYVKKKGYLYEDFNFQVHSENTDSLYIKLSQIETGRSLVLRNIYFESNSYELSEKSSVEIENAKSLLIDNPDISIQIEGHTDDIGKEAYNLTLSEQRAKEVYNALLQGGIEESRMKYKGFGALQPLVPNNSIANRQYNRRIEFRVIRTKQ